MADGRGNINHRHPEQKRFLRQALEPVDIVEAFRVRRKARRFQRGIKHLPDKQPIVHLSDAIIMANCHLSFQNTEAGDDSMMAVVEGSARRDEG